MPTSPPSSRSDGPQPRIDVCPGYAYSLGDVGIELSRRGGQEFDFWQQQGLTKMMGCRPDGKWACFEYAEIVARQNGKGGILEGRALAGFLALGEPLIMWSAHEYKTAMEAFRRVRSLLRALGESVNDNLIDIDGILVKVNNTNGEESFERLDTEQRIKFIARSKSSGRGFSGDCNIIDETFAYTDEQHAALLPTMSARPNPQIIYTSSPPLNSETGAILFRLRKRAEAGGDGSLGYRDWGLGGDLDHLEQIDLNDRAAWAQTNPAYGIRISEEFIARERGSMSAREFARERLGVWPPPPIEGGGVIDPEAWRGLKDEAMKSADDVVFGVEVSIDRRTAVIVVYSEVDGLGFTEVIDVLPGTARVVPRMLELKERWNPLAWGVDGKGPVLSLVKEMEEAGIAQPDDPEAPNRGDLYVLSLQEMAAAVGQTLDAIDQRTFRHTGDQILEDAAKGAKTRPVGDVEVWGRRLAENDISALTGFTVARFVHEAWADLVLNDYDVLESVF